MRSQRAERIPEQVWLHECQQIFGGAPGTQAGTQLQVRLPCAPTALGRRQRPNGGACRCSLWGFFFLGAVILAPFLDQTWAGMPLSIRLFTRALPGPFLRHGVHRATFFNLCFVVCDTGCAQSALDIASFISEEKASEADSSLNPVTGPFRKCFGTIQGSWKWTTFWRCQPQTGKA